MKKPNLILHFLLGGILKIFTKIKGQKIIEKTKIKGAAITLSNHTSFYDFAYTFSSIYPRRTNFIAARKMFHEKGLKGFMKLARAIPKSLMEVDISATKSTLKLLKKGGIVTIFPEGQISPSGSTMYFNQAISKLVKKANVNLYIIKHFGAGLVNPPWSKKSFKGKILTKKYLLLNKEDISSMSVEQIHENIVKHLEYRPSEFVLKTKYRYKVNDITNLNNLFYLCFNCNYEGLEIKDNNLFCPNCMHSFKYDNKGFVNDIAYEQVFFKQQNHVINQIKQNPDFCLSANAKVISIKDNKMQEVGFGKINLNKDTYTFKGIIEKQEVVKTFDVKNVSYLPSDVGRNIQIYEKNQVYQFELDIPYLPTKFVHAADYLYQLKTKN